MMDYGIDKPQAAGIISLMYIGWVIGSPLFGGLSDYLGRRKIPLYISSVGTLISLSAILYFPNESIYVLGTLLFLFGFFTCGFVPSFSILRELHPARASGTALGFINMINSMGSALAPPAVGLILDMLWKGSLQEDGTRYYSLGDYYTALASLPILVLLALLILPLLKETFCKTVENRA
jgi:MFS family permease